MIFLRMVMLGFLLLEVSNAFVLFFRPNSRQVHGMGMFPAWEKSKRDTDIHNLMRYLTIQVAGSKLILAALLIVIFVWGDTKLITLAGFALVISMLPFYLRLFPAMKKIDQNNQVNPKGFSMRLGFTITALIAALLLGSVLALFEIG